MSEEAEAVRVVTLLIAVLEQAIDRLDALDPTIDGPLLERSEELRDLCMAEMRYGRFARDDRGDETRDSL